MATEGRAATIVTRIGLAALLMLLAWHAFGLGLTLVRAIGYPFELDYGEGIVWFQMKQLLDGTAYGDIHRFGGIVFHYTPLYHLVTALVAATGIDELAAGRIVSAASTVAMMVLIGGIVRLVLVRSGGDRRAALLAAVIVALALLLCFAVKVWAPLMRVDMVAFALALGGVLCGLRAIERPGLITPAAIMMVLAVYTKQTMLCAPAALFLVLLLHRPRTAMTGILTCLVVGGVTLAGLVIATDGGFLRHIFLYNVNRLDPDRLNWIGLIVAGHFPLMIAALAGVAVAFPALRRFVADRRGATPSDVMATVLILYLLLTTLSLLLILKSGSGVNYFIEWMAVLAIFAGIAVAPAVERALDAGKIIPKGASFAGKLAVVALAAQAFMLPNTRYKAEMFTMRVPGLTELEKRIRAADKPVISDDMVLLMRAGKPVVWEPAIFAELGSNGIWDQRPFVRLIEQQQFAFFVTNQVRGGHLFNQRFNPPVAAAIERAYPNQERVAGLTVHTPAQVSGRGAPEAAAARR